jgi:hypothetical protein
MKEEFEMKIWGLQLDARQYIREVLVHIFPIYSHKYRMRPTKSDFVFPRKLDVLAQLRAPATVTIVLDLSHWAQMSFEEDEARCFVETVAGFLFPVLRKMLEGGLRVMAQVTLEAPPIEIKTEDLVSIDRWCRLLKEGHKLLVAAAKARRRR